MKEDEMSVSIPDPSDPFAVPESEKLVASGRRHPILTRMGAVILLAIGIAFVIMSAQLPFGSFLQPDAGTWPLMVSIALIFFAAISLALPEYDSEALDTPWREVMWFGISVVVCILFAVLFAFTGYFVSTAVFVFAMANIFARPKWWQAALVALGTGAGIWLLFDTVLGLPAP